MTRLAQAWRVLEREQRLAAFAALGLFVSMFLPWYSKTETFVVGAALKHAETSLTAFQDFSFVEAGVLLVSAGVLAILFARAERRSFQLPGGDGLIVMIAGGWTALLIFYRLLDKPGLQGNQRITATVGVQWGIFIALLVALGVLYSGGRMRAAARPLGASERTRAAHAPRAARAAPGDDADGDADGPQERATTVAQALPGPQTAASTLADRPPPAPRPRYPPAPGERQMSLEDPPADSA